jgi:glycosyltransferase involved in cell wall biosynthesis
MPVRDEANSLKAAIDSVQYQRQPAGWRSELVVALAPSADASEQILREFDSKTAAGCLRVVEIPAGDAASGLNHAIAASNGEVIIRVDGHSRLPADYAAIGIESLSGNVRIGNVGGMMIAVGDNPLQRAIAWAYGSRWGLGGGKFHLGGAAGEADSVYLGIFRGSALKQVGGFDPRFVRGQDWELNQRLRGAGYLVWFDPKLRVEYRPRNRLDALRQQFFDTGVWRGVLTRQQRGRAQLRYFAPPALVLASLVVVPAMLYLLAVAIVCLVAKLDWATRYRLLLVLPTMHYCWGLGFLRGFVIGIASKPG